MSVTSLNYGFADSFTVNTLVQESFERIGVQGQQNIPQKTNSAILTANLTLSRWAASEDILDLVQREMFGLVDGQAFYQIPNYVARVLKEELTRISYVRQNNGGVAIAPSGQEIPNACFNPESTSGVTQTIVDGWIGYQYPLITVPVGQSIWYVGILSLVVTNYTLAIEYSYDGETWLLAKQTTTEFYYPGITRWFVLEQPPIAIFWRIRETKGSTLSIQQLYFATSASTLPPPVYSIFPSDTPPPSPRQAGDITLGPLGRAEYLSLPFKFNPTAAPSAYYFNEKRVKSIYIYGNDYSSSNAIVYDAAIYAQDVTFLFQNPDMARKYFDPLCAEVAYQLAIKYGLPGDRVQMLQNDAMQKFAQIRSADKEDVDITMSVNTMSLWDI